MVKSHFFHTIQSHQHPQHPIYPMNSHSNSIKSHEIHGIFDDSLPPQKYGVFAGPDLAVRPKPRIRPTEHQVD